MREQLIQYVELLFAGARDCEDIKQEILQNTLDRYDDLVSDGKVPEAAYRLAISGIGDINEILGTKSQATPVQTGAASQFDDEDTKAKKWMRAIAVGLYILCPLPLIVLDELFDMDILGLCGLLGMVAVATVLIILGAKKEEKNPEKPSRSPLQKSISGLIWAVGLALYFILSFATNAWNLTWIIFLMLAALDRFVDLIPPAESGIRSPGSRSTQKLRSRVRSVIGAMGVAVYCAVSFATSAWYITWLIFPITGAVQELVSAIFDLKEAMDYEA